MLRRLGLVAGAIVMVVLAVLSYNFIRHYVYWSPTEEVTFRSDAIQLAGTFVKPAEEGVFPAILLLHGSGPEPRSEPPTRAVVNTLIRNGFAVFLYDKRGVGASGGDFESADYSDFIDDAVAAVEYLAHRADVDRDRIGLYTVSESGWFGPEIAFRTKRISLIFSKVGAPLSVADTVMWEVRNDYISAGIAESDVQALVDLAARRWAYYRDAATNPELADGSERAAINGQLATLRENVPGAAEVLPVELLPYDAARYAEIAAAQFYDPSPFLLAIDVPMFYAYGEDDINVPTRSCIAALEVLIHERGKDIEYTVYPGAGHDLLSWTGLLHMGFPPDYLDRLAVWTAEKMNAK